MAQSFIAYDKDLPEIPGRCPWEKPASFLVKDETAPNGWRVNEEGRRPSKLLLTGKLRQAVDRWRDEDYPGASPVTERLFEYWFKEDHEVAGFAERSGFVPALDARTDFERRFAYFPDEAPDVLRFASLGTTEQGESGVSFRVNYLKSSGAIGFYHPNWVAIQKTPQGEINWIIETKGRVWEGTEAKDAAMEEWCALVSRQSGAQWRYARVNQRDFDKLNPKLLDDVIAKSDAPILL